MYSVDVVYAQEVVPHFILFTPIFGGVVSLGFACLWYGACCWHDFSIRWLLRIRSARVDRNKNFDLRREYFYIDRCVKTFISKKGMFYFTRASHVLSYHLL